MKYLPLFVVAALILAVTVTALAKEDLELKTCQHQCRQTKQLGEEQKQECEKQCEKYSKEKERREKEGKSGEREKATEKKEGGTSLEENPRQYDPEWQQPWRGSRGEREGCECRRGRRQEEFGEEEEEGEWGMRRQQQKREPWREQEEYGERRQQQKREPWRKHQEEEEFGGGGRRQPWRRHQEEEEFGGEGRRQPWRRHQEEEEFGGSGRRQPWRRHQEEEEFGGEGRRQPWRREEEFGERGGEGHPYVFKDEHFQSTFRTQLGRERTLPKFTEVSRLLKGIENFRVNIFEAKPMTFVLPRHCDADAVLFVAKGRGTITLVHPDNKESFNIEKGHIMRIRAGTSVYLVNSDEEERLVLVKLIKPVSNPGRFEMFFGAGGENPESFFSAFSDEILEASFKASSDELDRIFNQQNEGVIVQASREQIQSLTKQQKQQRGIAEEIGSAGSRTWPFGGGSRKGSRAPINLLNQKPSFQNEFGSLFEIDSDDFQPLQDLDLSISFANVTEGGMIAPHFNTRATKIAVVVKGRGRFEMACPHVGHQQQQQRQQSRSGSRSQGRGRQQQRQGETPVHYQKISGNLNVGTVFIVPTGHPFVTVASQDENLQIICFEVNAENNRKIQLAGQKSIIKQFEREAKELSFGESAEFIEDILNRQDEEFFFAGPEQQQQQRHQRGGRRIRPSRQTRGREEEEEGRADE